MHSTLIAPALLTEHLNDPTWAIVDVRFDLTNPAAGEQQYAAGHVPGARYAHLDRDLSGAKTGTNGRHPLPAVDDMAAHFGAMGISADTQVVIYDADSGMYAARMWWMLRYLGHDAVAVLDGGFARWVREGGAVATDAVTVAPATFVPHVHADWRLAANDVAEGLGDRSRQLVDARSNERFRGMGETLDTVGGHIPGASNYFFQTSLTGDKTFKSADELRAQWQAVLKDRDAKQVVMYCGSGVTACHNLLSLEVAGLSGARIFPGSWSEWSADPSRPIATDE